MKTTNLNFPIPVIPTKGCRITLTAHETTALWMLLRNVTEHDYDGIPAVWMELLHDIEGKVSDKLTFEFRDKATPHSGADRQAA